MVKFKGLLSADYKSKDKGNNQHTGVPMARLVKPAVVTMI